MARQFDATTKQLIETYPADWLALAGLPWNAPVQVVDADLSTFSPAADKLVRVGGDDPYIGHIELMARRDAHLDRRVLMYNAAAGARHHLPVRSVVYMLRPRAFSPKNTGRVQDLVDPHCRIDFRYRRINVWELPVEQVLSGGLGTLPLAPISAVKEPHLPDVCRRVAERLERETPPATADALWTAAYILSGLRHAPDLAGLIMRGVRQMKESATYQAILAEGRAEGEREILLDIGTHRFGAPDAQTLAVLRSISDAKRLVLLRRRLLTASGWEELLKNEPPAGS